MEEVGMMRRFASFVVVSLLALVALPTASATADPSVKTIRLLARPAPIPGANGIVFDEGDQLYVGSVGGREIVKLDPNSGRILARFGPDQGFEGADDVALGPDGAIYYTALFTGEVGRIAPDGTHGTVANLSPGVNPITFSDDGRLFVGIAFFGDALYEVDPAGLDSPRLVNSGLGLNGFDWWDGYLYAPQMYAGTAVRIDVATGAHAVVADGFVFPTAVDFDPAGRMFVLDSGAGEVLRVDPDTGKRRVVATLGGDPDNMAFDSRGRLFVSDNSSGAIVQVLPKGGIRPVSPSGLVYPGGLAVLAAGKAEIVYAADTFRLFGIDGRTGRTALEVEASITGGGALAPPMSVGAHGSDLVLSSWFGSAVQVFDPRTLQVEASCGDPDVPLNAIGFGSDVLISELVTHRVAVLDESTCARTTLVELPVPTGLATDGEDLWVADWALGMVFQIADEGAFISPVLVASGLAGPEGLAVSRDGGLLVVETVLHRLSHIDLGTGAVTPLVEGLALGTPGPPGTPPIWVFDGIAVGPSGAVYVSAHGLYRIDLVK
jgi:sugar lactone lactonase YvrE